MISHSLLSASIVAALANAAGASPTTEVVRRTCLDVTSATSLPVASLTLRAFTAASPIELSDSVDLSTLAPEAMPFATDAERVTDLAGLTGSAAVADALDPAPAPLFLRVGTVLSPNPADESGHSKPVVPTPLPLASLSGMTVIGGLLSRRRRGLR